jgi:hypothetical protein
MLSLKGKLYEEVKKMPSVKGTQNDELCNTLNQNE